APKDRAPKDCPHHLHTLTARTPICLCRPGLFAKGSLLRSEKALNCLCLLLPLPHNGKARSTVDSSQTSVRLLFWRCRSTGKYCPGKPIQGPLLTTSHRWFCWCCLLCYWMCFVGCCKPY